MSAEVNWVLSFLLMTWMTPMTLSIDQQGHTCHGAGFVVDAVADFPHPAVVFFSIGDQQRLAGLSNMAGDSLSHLDGEILDLGSLGTGGHLEVKRVDLGVQQEQGCGFRLDDTPVADSMINWSNLSRS